MRAHGFDKFNYNVYFHVVLLTSTRIPAHYGQQVPSSKTTRKRTALVTTLLPCSSVVSLLYCGEHVLISAFNN